MYRGKDREETYLFKELQPFGGQLEEGNRWLKIKALIPWGEMERTYAGYFSHRGRPGLDGRLVIGLFLEEKKDSGRSPLRIFFQQTLRTVV